MEKEITLTEQELEDIKDETKFREMVILKLDQLNGIPKKVWRLEIWSRVHWTVILLIIAGILSMTWRVLAK